MRNVMKKWRNDYEGRKEQCMGGNSAHHYRCHYGGSDGAGYHELHQADDVKNYEF